MLVKHTRQATIHRVRAFIDEAKQHRARPVQDSRSQNVAEVEVERQNHAGFLNRAPNDLVVGRTFKTHVTNVNRVVAEACQEVDGMRRYAGVRQESHLSGAQRTQLVLGKRGGVRKRLSDVVSVKVG